MRKAVKTALPWIGDIIGALCIIGTIYIMCVLVWVIG